MQNRRPGWMGRKSASAAPSSASSAIELHLDECNQRPDSRERRTVDLIVLDCESEAILECCDKPDYCHRVQFWNAPEQWRFESENRPSALQMQHLVEHGKNVRLDVQRYPPSEIAMTKFCNCTKCRMLLYGRQSVLSVLASISDEIV